MVIKREKKQVSLWSCLLRVLPKSESAESGFTLLELIITLLIISILAAGAIPVARNLERHEKERQLKRSLREIRAAIDAYHYDCNVKQKFLIYEHKLKSACYPPELKTLFEGVRAAKPGGTIPTGETLRYLRRIPIDPITGKDDWVTESLTGEVNSSNHVYDIHSNSRQLSLDGKTYYSEW